MNILVTLNSGYMKQLAIMLTSLCISNQETEFTVYIAHSSIDKKEFYTLENKLKDYKMNIVPIKIKSNILGDAPITDRYPKEMYYRIFAAQYLPNDIDRILYLDPDLVVINNISTLYNTDFENNLFIAASHVKKTLRKLNEIRLDMPADSYYINSGVMVLNLTLLRETQNIQQVLDYIEKYKKLLILPDQDVISSIYGGRILEVDRLVYNMTEHEYAKTQLSKKTRHIDLKWIEENSVIVHYCGRNKPWKKNYKGNLGYLYKKYEKLVPKTSQNKKMLLIVNPNAGKGEIKAKILDIIDLFTKNNFDILIKTTQASGEIPSLIAKYKDKINYLVSCGGDGTLNESVNGLMQNKCDLLYGFIPCGTVNDFANSLRIPKNDLLKCAENIVNGKEFKCDIGLFNDKYFTYIAAFGAFTQVSYGTKQDFKNLFGRAAYILEGIASVPSIRSYHIKLTGPTSTIEDDFIFGMISNSISVSGFHITNKIDISLNDGLLEVLLVKKPKNPIELQSIINAVVTQDLGSEFFYIMKCNKVKIETQEEIAWTLDGEFGGNHKNIDIDIKKKAIKFIAPIN